MLKSRAPEPDELVDCPYCQPPRNHQIRYKRLNIHLTEMKKIEPSLRKLKVCRYNALHLIEESVYEVHLLSCPNAADAIRQVMEDIEETQKLIDNFKPEDRAGVEFMDDWESELSHNVYKFDASSSRAYTRPEGNTTATNEYGFQGYKPKDEVVVKVEKVIVNNVWQDPTFNTSHLGMKPLEYYKSLPADYDWSKECGYSYHNED